MNQNCLDFIVDSLSFDPAGTVLAGSVFPRVLITHVVEIPQGKGNLTAAGGARQGWRPTERGAGECPLTLLTIGRPGRETFPPDAHHRVNPRHSTARKPATLSPIRDTFHDEISQV